MGVTQIDTVLMVLGVCLGMTDKEREVTTSLMIEGFRDCATEAGTSITGGQSIMSPWPIIGGVAISSQSEKWLPVHAKIGDQLVLTKPLGNQIAVNVFQWYRDNPDKWNKVKNLTNSSEIEEAFLSAEMWMGQLNLRGAKMMKKYGARAATDVTGFGILGHAHYLAQAQRNQNARFRLDRLPIIRNMVKLDKIARDFKMLEGRAAETSGGILMAVPQERLDELLREEKDVWHIGEVVTGDNGAEIVRNVEVIEV